MNLIQAETERGATFQFHKDNILLPQKILLERLIKLTKIDFHSL